MAAVDSWTLFYLLCLYTSQERVATSCTSHETVIIKKNHRTKKFSSDKQHNNWSQHTVTIMIKFIKREKMFLENTVFCCLVKKYFNLSFTNC